MNNPVESEITQQDLHASHAEFVEEADARIDAFWEGKYDTFERDSRSDRLSLLLRQEHVRTNLSEIKFAYAFLRLIRDIFSLGFVQLLHDYARQFGFEPHKRFYESINLEYLAIDLVVHYPLWDWRTYDSGDYRGMGYSRDESRDGMSITMVAFIPLLGMRFDEQGKPIEIRPVSWATIQAFLGTFEARPA